MPDAKQLQPGNKLKDMNKVITIFINSDTSNPISVDAVISAEKENGSWSWSIDELKRVGFVIGDKEEIDITKLLTKKAVSLLTSQVADQDDQIIEALEERKAPKKDSLFELACNITRQHAKIHYGIDLK